MRDARPIIERLRDERRLHPSWPTAQAAALLWGLTSFHVWDDLVTEAKVPPAAHAEIITTAALSALAAPWPAPISSLASPGPRPIVAVS
jgi:CHASE2 domain-containing sensor protein